MREVLIEKVVVNIGVGEPGDRLEKAVTVLERLTGVKPVRTKAWKSIRDLNVRKGEEIGCKVTLRKEKAKDFLNKAFPAVNNKIKKSSFDTMGNISFGVKEHIFLPGVRYDPELGIFGLDVCIRLARKGLRVTLRGSRPSSIGKPHVVGGEEAAEYLSRNFGVQVA